MILVTGPHRQRQDGFAVHVPQHPEPARRQHLDRRGPLRNPAARRQPGQRQRQGGPHVRRRAEVVPAPGSGHHHGRRNPRPRDRRHRDQGGADGPPRAVDAAHQRRADDAHAPAQHGRRAVQHRVVGDPDHGAAAGPQAVLATARSPRTFRRRRCCAPGFSRRGPRRLVAALRSGRLRPLQGHRLQGPRRHLPGHADHRRHAPGDHAQRQRARHRRAGAARKACKDLRQSGLLKVKAGITSLEEIEAITNE